MMKNIKGIFFDFDDTLQDRQMAFYKYASCIIRKYFPELSPKEVDEHVKYMDSIMEGGYLKRDLFFAKLIEDWNWQNPPSLKDLEDEYNRELPVHTTLFEDTNEVVAELKKRGYKLGIITNGFAPLQHKKLDVSGLRPMFDVIVVSGDHDFAKPDPRLFKFAANEMGLDCENIAMIGDHPINDIQGAINSSMTPVWMNYGFFKGKSTEGVDEILNLTQLLDLF